jgi:drug/metabolite transporter (DMT)-like permease
VLKAVQPLMSPVALAALRSGAGALVLALVAVSTGRLTPLPPRAEWPRLVLLGLAGNTVFQLCLIGGLHLTSPAHSALIVSLSPILTALLAWLALGEPLSQRRLLGIGLAFAGAAVLVTRDTGLDAAGALAGDVLSVGSALAWAVYSVVGKPLLASRSPLQTTTLAMAVGALPLLGLGLPGLAAVPWRVLDPTTWALLGYLSILALALNYVLYYWALKRAPLAHVSVFQYLTPVVAVLLSVGAGLQAPTIPLVASALAVLGGVALAQRG